MIRPDLRLSDFGKMNLALLAGTVHVWGGRGIEDITARGEPMRGEIGGEIGRHMLDKGAHRGLGTHLRGLRLGSCRRLTLGTRRRDGSCEATVLTHNLVN